MPHKPADYDKTVLYAVRAFNEGVATASQQHLVRDWLLNAVCHVDDMSYRPGGEEGRRATDFAEGKRYVANQFRKMLHPLTMEAMVKAEAKTTRGKEAK